jgi:hypothetical protein
LYDDVFRICGALKLSSPKNENPFRNEAVDLSRVFDWEQAQDGEQQ